MKTHSHNQNFLVAAILAALIGFLCPNLRAQQVTAALSQEFTGVGRPVQLQVTVTGGRGAQVPPDLKIDGLEARFAGKSQQMQMQMSGGRVSTNVTSVYTYLVIPLRTGSFTIPAIPVTVNGKTFKTAPLTLQVGGGGGNVPVRPAIPVQPGQPQQMPPAGQPQIQTAPPSDGSSTQAGGKIAFGDLLVPKKSAFAGEIVPVEIRFYFDAAYPVRLQDRPSFSGEGFTVLEFSKPVERQQEIDGRVYNVVSFQTALTPVKTGTLEIPAATLEAQIQMPGQSRSFDDFFGGLFGATDERQVTVSTDPAQLEVKPLPSDGRPADFGGAIGQFSLAADTSLTKAGPGEPFTLDVTVAGRGNFSAMSAPTLVEDEGWRTYPPNATFTPSASDPIGFNGEKTFEYMILARGDQSKTPAAEFSFFDPGLEKYVTLKTAPIAVTAEGGATATPPSIAGNSAVPTPTPQAAAPSEPAPAVRDLLVSNFQPATFEPFIKSRGFLIASGLLAVAWCAALLLGIGRVATSSKLAKSSAARRESRKLLKKMQSPGCETDTFFQLADDFIHSRLAPHDHVSNTRDLVAVAALKPETKNALQALFDQHDALKYSTSSASKITAEERRQVLDLLNSFDHEIH